MDGRVVDFALFFPVCSTNSVPVVVFLFQQIMQIVLI
jgi:hypothetical protein